MPARARRRGAVRLVERGLVDEADAQLRGDLFQRCRHLERMRAAFQRAGTGDQSKRQAIAELGFADLDDGIGGGRHEFLGGDHETWPASGQPWRGWAASRNSFPFSRCALASEFCPRHGKKALPTHLPIKRREAERRKARSPGRISGCGARHVNECCHSSTLRARSPFGAPPRHLPRRTHPDIGSALSPALPETRRIRALPSATCLSLPRSAETGRCAGRAVTRGRPGAVCETARGNRTCSTFRSHPECALR